MNLFNNLVLKFEQADWSKNPELGLIDTILEKNPEIIKLMKNDIVGKEKESIFGRKDVPTVEQIVRAAIFKEMRGLDYRELEYAQSDSRICANFIKLDERKPFCFQMFQKYISKINKETLKKTLVLINKIAIEEGFETLQKVSQDTTVVKSNIHHPTNNSLVWDCIRKSKRLMEQLKEEIRTLNFINYTKSAKRTYYKINVTKGTDKRHDLFCKQLILFTKVINQTSNAIKKKSTSLKSTLIKIELRKLLELMNQVYDIAYRKEINGENVPNDAKLFSIFELHTDIIVKGQREVTFGHKVSIATGVNLIVDCSVEKGNPSDVKLFPKILDRIIDNYEIIPRDSATDGGYASKENLDYAKNKGIVNIVFNKVVGSMQNIVSSLNIETRLKKWRSTIEAVISNLKRGFNISKCNWKGWEHFQSKVLWSAIAYNFRVLTALVLQELKVGLKCNNI